METFYVIERVSFEQPATGNVSGPTGKPRFARVYRSTNKTLALKHLDVLTADTEQQNYSKAYFYRLIEAWEPDDDELFDDGDKPLYVRTRADGCTEITDLSGQTYVRDERGHWIPYSAAAALMCSSLADCIHAYLAPCSDQFFFDEYAARHFERFGEEFPPYVGGAW